MCKRRQLVIILKMIVKTLFHSSVELQTFEQFPFSCIGQKTFVSI